MESADRTVAVVGRESSEVVERLVSAGFTPCVVSSALAQDYRASHVAVVLDSASYGKAALMQRFSRIPWIAWLDGGFTAPKGLIAQAAAVVADARTAEAVRRRFPDARLVVDPGTDRLRRLLLDIALAPAARTVGGGAGAALGDAWTFLNARLTRLAIRLVALSGKAPAPTHPRHLVADAPWHHWYLEHLRPGERVLDVGCSNGVHTVAAAEVAGSVVGVDLDARALAAARDRAAAAGREVEFRRLDLTDDAALEALPGTPYDAVLLLDVLEHLTDRPARLRAIRAVLRSDGRLILAVPNRQTPYRRALRRAGAFAFIDPDHKVEYTDTELRAELAAGGFRVVVTERGGYDTPFAGFATLTGALSLRFYAMLARRRARLVQRHPDRATALRLVAVPI